MLDLNVINITQCVYVINILINGDCLDCHIAFTNFDSLSVKYRILTIDMEVFILKFQTDLIRIKNLNNDFTLHYNSAGFLTYWHFDKDSPIIYEL